MAVEKIPAVSGEPFASSPSCAVPNYPPTPPNPPVPGARIVPNPQHVARPASLEIIPSVSRSSTRCELGQLALRFKSPVP
jgi:hypothetical protein